MLIIAAGATANANLAAAWTATASSSNSGSATLTSAGFAVSLAAVTGGSAGWSLANTAATNVNPTGSALADTITGGGGNETLIGGAGMTA